MTDLDNFGPDPLIRLPSPVNRWTLGLAHANLGGSSLPAPDAGGDTWLPLFAQVCHQVNQEYFRFVLDVLGEADEPLLIPVADMGLVYAVSSVVFGGWFIYESHVLYNRAVRGTEPRPMRVFHASITYLTLIFVAIAVDPLLPF